MIKNVELKPYDKSNHLPTYVGDVKTYALIATVPGNYEINLAKLTVGTSVSAGNLLSHALFESYTDHGHKMIETKSRVSGYEREFMAVKSVMLEAGIEFDPIVPCHFLDLLKGLGAYYQAGNPEIRDYAVVSQKC